MDLSVNVGYFGPHISDQHNLIKKLDQLGVSCIWTAEAYGYDAITPLAYFSAITKNIELGSGIMQIPSRTPAMTAMSAVTLDKLSNGRFRLGLGVSGPQVVEGWHGVPYGKPLLKTREYIEVVKKILERKEPLEFQGEYYTLPNKNEETTGLGKPLKLIEKPLRKDIPIYLAAIGPKNIELAAELADGWLPFMYSPYIGDKIFNKYLEKGFLKSSIKNKSNIFNIVATVFAKICSENEVDEYLIPARSMYTLYVGGMGAKDKNFYFNLMCDYGYEEEAHQIQSLFLSGKKLEAEKIFPNKLLDDLTMVGSKNSILDKLEVWKSSNVTELSVTFPLDLETIAFIKENI
ncbi:MAG: LLM class F420-dependent oxidoreductase [Actinomycetota bacterium]|nr:LLM class F420-dependent oxidoreductase [Actinomycetota bacterium]MDA3013648.1 LLM class F420-dependent oxidoreductase [Actinomycetota bacterium]